MRLLVVEENGSDVALQVVDDRWPIVQTDTADEALSIMRHGSFDLVLLNIASLGQDGFAFIKRLRTARNDTPVMALTGSEVADRTLALGLGADDAVAQPMNAEEIRARITAVIRRNKGHSHSVLRVGSLSLCLETRDVRFQDRPIHLTGKECAVLELLMLRKGMVITKDMLLNRLYGGMDEPEMKIIDVFVCKLRRRLERAGLPDVIDTVWGRGYTMRDIGLLKQPSAAMPVPPQQLVA